MSRLRIPVTDHDHIRGRGPITLVEYGDFQCPFCGQAFWVLRNLEERLKSDLRFVFRHFPIGEIHPLAQIAAEAAEAAGAQGKFWEMHDLLYENQPELEPEVLVSYAGQLHLDLDVFSGDLASRRYREHIHEDFMGGVRSGVNGTPSLFINGERFDEPVEEPLLLRAIDAARGHGHQGPVRTH